MKHSIRIRLVCMLAGMLAFTLFICWFVNRTFLEGYYERSKIDTLGKVFSEVNELYTGQETEEEGDELSLYLEKTGSNKNMNLYIFNIYSLFNQSYLDIKYPVNTNPNQRDQLRSRVMVYLNNVLSTKMEDRMQRLYKTEKYTIYKVYDERIGSEFIELFGNMESGDTILIRTNFDSIQESVGIANRFLAYIGIIAAVIGVLVMYFLSRSFTRPIQVLSDIAKRMSKLNFDVKYQEERQDEIGELGSSINMLSGQLEQTISELKSANNELKRDIEKREAIDEMRKEFLSNVSHELKTPIALIQGYAEGLMDNISDDVESRAFYCDVIVDEAAKMNNMVKKLLSLNQLEFGNNEISFERFDINALIQSVLHSSEIMFRQKEVRLIYEETEPVYVWADEYMAEEVLNNYVSNALNHVNFPEEVSEGAKQAGSGEKRIELRVIRQENSVRISVFNTGRAIPQDSIDHIWEKFYKVDKARTREYGGNGIGLSIVKAIMNSLNQDFGVRNWSDGVEFWFELDSHL